MGKKAKRLPTSKNESGHQFEQDDKIINDLIEKRKIQQEALTKIMTSMDAMIKQLNHSTSRLVKESNSKQLSK